MDNESRGGRWIARGYEVVIGITAGFSVGFFAWLIADRLRDAGSIPMWPFTLSSILVVYAVVVRARRRGDGAGWVHLLWIPVAAFVVLMTMVILALRSFT